MKSLVALWEDFMIQKVNNQVYNKLSSGIEKMDAN